MHEFRMPSLGADMDAGILVEWKVKPGDRVKRGDIVAVVDTQKAAIEVETFHGGIIDELVVDEGTEVPVGTVLATIRDSDEAPTRARETRERPQPAATAAVTTEVAPEKAPPAEAKQPSPPSMPPPRTLRVSPAARRRARELGIDPAGIAGTGPHGAITLADIEAAAEGEAEEAPPKKAAVRDRQAEIMRAMGAAMARSKREIPHYYLAHTVDLGAAMDWLKTRNASRPATERLLPAALLLKATALALRDVPALNGFYTDGELHMADAVHQGTAVALRGGGIIAPAIHDADHKSLDELMKALSALVKRARAGTLRSSELSESTATVTSLGDRGADRVFGVIYPPQVALVGFGRIDERPCVHEGEIVARPQVTVSLSADHRASDGHQGSKFLRRLERRLAVPEEL